MKISDQLTNSAERKGCICHPCSHPSFRTDPSCITDPVFEAEGETSVLSETIFGGCWLFTLWNKACWLINQQWLTFPLNRVLCSKCTSAVIYIWNCTIIVHRRPTFFLVINLSFQLLMVSYEAELIHITCMVYQGLRRGFKTIILQNRPF